MTITIQVSSELVEKLKTRKMYENDSYEDVIWDLIEDTMELSEETKKNILQSEKEFREGKVHTFEEIKKELGL